jgi:hypothetical protein
MPHHKRVTTCRKSGGPLLNVCSVCGGGEGSLTTDCPGAGISGDKQQEIYETRLDYTSERGWHQGTEHRMPRFEPEPPSRSVDWPTIDRRIALQHELSQKAIAWVLADRIASDHAAGLTRLEDELDVEGPTPGHELSDRARELLSKLEYEKIGFRLADQRAQRCDEEFRQVARKLAETLEQEAP